MKKTIILIFILIIAACNSTEENIKNAENNYSYDIEEKIKELGIILGEPSKPVANYVSSVRSGNLVFMSGAGPEKSDGEYITGKIGSDLTIDEGYEAAKLTGIALLSALKDQIGDLNKVERIIKVLGMVNADPSFTQQPAVINGFSDLMVEVFGERGKHARAAVGMGSLPMNIACEIEMIVQISD